MSQLDVTSQQPETQDPEGRAAHSHGGHGWMMIACCIPMLVIAIVLVATGVAGVGFIFVALMCTAMMAMMMRGMSGSSEPQDERQRD
jgi:hypothetical protein